MKAIATMLEQLETYKKELAVARGMRKQLLKEMEKEFGIKTVKEAKVKIKEWNKSVAHASSALNRSIRKLEEELDENRHPQE